ncbi:HAMP domain-containing sensor histidine kinase [Paenibacillus sp. FSL K6-0276]|uniref:HAMP domain-containing sensor histidine kinase n=1 Tax=Paenibacillus sp. FSL K6-0276 TaxID=2921450 RepID=UPI0030EE59D5
MMKINKISTKLLIMVSIILLIVFGTSYLLHNYFSSDYYLYKMKTKINAIYDEVKDLSLDQLVENETSIENNNNVTIVRVKNNGSVAEINDNLQFALFKDKVALNKFWITEEVLQKVNEGNTVNLLFNQGKLKSSLLTKIYEQDGSLILIGTVVVHNTDALNIVNQFSFYSILLGIIISLLLVAYFSKKIITPLEQLQDVAKDISNLDFKQVTIKSGDEIEELSKSINQMSQRLKSAHTELEKKNQSLNTLISSISHEVKTPLSLIQAYTIGIQDDLDNGTYTDIILEQVKYTSDMVDYLIKLSKIQKTEVHKEKFDLKELLLKVISQYNITLKNKNLTLQTDFHSAERSIVEEDISQMEIVFNNLISNAIKYGEENIFAISLAGDTTDTLKFTITNKTTRLKEEHLAYIWDPFYVIEESRNKEISGTGLGLSIVAEILAKNDLKYEAILEDSYISFSVWFDVKD